MAKISIDVDQAVGCAYIRLSDHPVAKTVEHADGVLVDLDEFGVAVGLELLDQHAPIPFAALTGQYHVHSDVIELLRMVRPDVASFVTVTSGVGGSSPGVFGTQPAVADA